MSDVFWHFSDEEGGLFAEAVGGLGGVVADGAAFAESGVHIGVAAEVVAQAGGYVLALGDEFDMWWAVLPYLVVEEWIVGAAEYDGVDVGVHPEEGVDAFTDEVVGTWLVVFSVFYEGYPHGACESGDGAVGREFMDFEVVGLGAYGAFGGEDSDVACPCVLSHDFCCWAYDSQHAAVGVTVGEVVLLYVAQRFC